MTSVNSVASITKMINEFSDMLTSGMKKNVRKRTPSKRNVNADQDLCKIAGVKLIHPI